jgi:HK97 family phage portal protein
MILSRAVQRTFPRKQAAVPAQLKNETRQTMTLPELVEFLGTSTISGERVTAATARSIASFYRGVNIIGDDIASMPLQVFTSRKPGQIQRVPPDPITHNLAWLLEQGPNRYQTPAQFKKMYVEWLIHHGNAYIWQPPRSPRELFLLRSDKTYPEFDVEGNRWFHTTFSNNQPADLPDVEVTHVMINPDVTGFVGRGVLQFARERLGIQLGAYRTQGKLYKNGLNANAVIQMAGELSPDARRKVKDEFLTQAGGAENAFGVVVIDQKMLQFTPITMKGTDMQFLESIQATDLDIANFLGIPLQKLNQGKQAYNSNEQQDLDYLKTTLNPYLVQLEQSGARGWLSEAERPYTYIRFERSAILRTDAKSRGEYLNAAIQSGRMTPNEARQIEDMPAFTGGDQHYMPANILSIDGSNPNNPAGGSNGA